LVQKVTQRVVRPAEVFFTTLVEVYTTHGPSAREEYEAEVRDRMGAAWDDRLLQPARVFHTTARAVSAVVGSGRFFGGALQMGRRTFHDIVDDLIDRWETVLSVSDAAVDRYLPELPPSSPHVAAAVARALVDSELALDGSAAAASASASASAPTPSPAADSVEDENNPTPIGATKRENRSALPLAAKVSRRLRQRLPLLRELPAALRTQLLASTWFAQVDSILRENKTIRTMASVVGELVAPAEHFYNTAVDAFNAHAQSVADFVLTLRYKMGAAWDERLRRFAESFFHSARAGTSSVRQQSPPAARVADDETETELDGAG
jgi:hypothetical protein